MERELLRIDEVAQVLGVGRSMVYQLILDGELPVIKLGRATRISASRVRSWAAAKTLEADERAAEKFSTANNARATKRAGS